MGVSMFEVQHDGMAFELTRYSPPGLCFTLETIVEPNSIV